MKMMNWFKQYLYANLYLLLPTVLMMVLLPDLIPRLTELIRPSVFKSYSACDYRGGGGSINLCENEVWWRGLVLGFAVSTFLGWLVSKTVIWCLGIHWLSPLYGLVFFYGVSAAWLFLSVILYDVSQGIGEAFRASYYVIVLGSVLATSWVNFKIHLQKEVRPAATTQSQGENIMPIAAQTHLSRCGHADIVRYKLHIEEITYAPGGDHL